MGLAGFCLAAPLIAAAGNPLYTADRGMSALNHAVSDLRHGELDRFALGRSFFNTAWVEAPASTSARDGLGPLFNANSCTACHRRNGGGNRVGGAGQVDRSIVLRLAEDARYGGQIASDSIPGVPREAGVAVNLRRIGFRYPDGERRSLTEPEFRLENPRYGTPASSGLYPRRAPPLTGMGLIESIPAAAILARADPADDDGDGISGKPNRVWSEGLRKWKLGRFGWKASAADLIEQTALALIDDMGLTSPWFPHENCSPAQRECAQAWAGAGPDVPAERVEAIAFYLRSLKTPHPVPNAAGRQLFTDIGCAACHRSGYLVEGGLSIDPYSDFLLHDLGEALADGSSVQAAGPREWRTPPLWGIGLAQTLNPEAGYLHDGRAATIEEAILWHAGEATTARVKFTALDASKRASVLKFLESL